MIFNYNESTGYLKFKGIGKNLASHSSLLYNLKDIIDRRFQIDQRWTDASMMRKMKIARVSYVNVLQGIEKAVKDRFFIMPCNLDWSSANNRRFSVSIKHGKCLKFIASSIGDVFVVFATNPNNEWSWYVLQISSYGVALYKVVQVAFGIILFLNLNILNFYFDFSLDLLLSISLIIMQER